MKLAAGFTLVALAACGHQKRADGPPPPSLTTITAEDIERSPGLSLEQLLVSRVPGLSLVRASDGRTVIHIRGTSSLAGDQEPLFVLNGIPLDTQVSGNLSSINPKDIEYIQVLRDAASTAMYGVRGSNGVIVIKTKS